MAQTLKYKIENATKSSTVRTIDYQGASGLLTIDRALIEAFPLDSDGNVNLSGKSFSAELPVEALADFPEGATLIVTVEVDPATIPAPAPAEPDPAPADPAPVA